MMPNGLKKFVRLPLLFPFKLTLEQLVNNTSEVDILLMHNKSYAAEIAHGVSAAKRIAIIEKCRVLGVKSALLSILCVPN